VDPRTPPESAPPRIGLQRWFLHVMHMQQVLMKEVINEEQWQSQESNLGGEQVLVH
jgi:hypothetical protein